MLNVIAYGQSDAIWEHHISKKEMLTDFDTLYSRILQKHINPYWKFNKDDYYACYNKLRMEIDKEDKGFVTENVLPYFQKLISFTGDIHTSAYLLDGYGQARLFPFYLKKFHSDGDDNYFITTVDSLYSDVIGYKLEKIGNYGINEVINRLAEILPPSSSHANYYLIRMALRNATLLHSLRIINDARYETFTFSNGIQTIKKKISSNYFTQGLTKWIWYDDIMKTLPLTKKNRLSNYWYEYLPEKKSSLLEI